MKIFRFRLLTFLHSNSSPIVHSAIPGIFQGSFIEQDNVSYSMESTKSNDIPILRNVSDSFSDYYRKYLQRCGILVPKDGNSSGPDAYVIFHNGQTRYVVGFLFKFYHKTEFSKTNIKEEAEQFFQEVISVLNDESFSSVQLCFQFVVVVCTRYDRSVGFSVEEQNIVEDASGFVTQHSSGSTLNESSRSCLQLVVVSQRNLEIYLGRDNVEILRKIGEANRGEFRAAASSSLSSSFDWNTFLRERYGFTEASFIERYARQLRVFSPRSFSHLDDSTLLIFGIAPRDVILILRGIHEFLEEEMKHLTWFYWKMLAKGWLI
ncbi:archaeal ATPase [Galdieria sulphuraria]|uniref:Archaeal ATPase n=1 Tax=Galdieria sulphuraria TaxID=130081 RepID=M2WQ22_GALSU|nr:archaeal ATPase [Galdieria sulphuraria]EME25860.1 archaeal ATPase [Galdieria sulphuraria]|eukprot:XP_005702380.1 archaeal ATPase [Galdieria sulphuraria]